jgi:hypothetical protein
MKENKNIQSFYFAIWLIIIVLPSIAWNWSQNSDIEIQTTRLGNLASLEKMEKLNFGHQTAQHDKVTHASNPS